MISTILALVFVIEDLVGYQVRIGYGVNPHWCNYTFAGPPFRNLVCTADTCNGTVHTCTNNCPDGDPASGNEEKACYIGPVKIANENQTVSSDAFAKLANLSVPCQTRTAPCGTAGGDCFALINENGALGNTCGYSCPAPYSRAGSNGPNGSACEIIDCLDRASAQYNVAFSRTTDIAVPYDEAHEDAIPHPFFVAKIGGVKVFQSQVFPNETNSIVNKNFTLPSDAGNFVIEAYNWVRENDTVQLLGSVQVLETEVSPTVKEFALSNGAGNVKLTRLAKVNPCGAVGWCKANSRVCVYEACDDRVSDKKAKFPCGPDCYQQVNYRGALVDICRMTCPEKYVPDNATGTCKVDTSITADTGEAALKKKTDQELTIAFGVVLPIMVVVGIIITVIVFCVLYQINKKKSKDSQSRIGVKN